MNFEDLHEFSGHTHYPVCNEHVPQWKDALDGIEVGKAAGICSGGEIAFFAIAPIVKEQLVLVDHSYVSLWAALGKYKTIEKLGAEKAHKLISTARYIGYGAPYRDYHYATRRYRWYIPATGKWTDNEPAEAEQIDELYALFKAANKGLATETCMNAQRQHWWPMNFHPVWRYITVDDVAAFHRNRTNLQILHGDINDLVKAGPFEFLYLSNALSYAGRDGTDFKITDIVPEGGLVAFACSGGRAPRLLDGWERVAEVKSNAKPGYSSSWTHVVARVPSKAKAAKLLKEYESSTNKYW